MEWRTGNPCDRLLPVLGYQHHLVRHRKALSDREVGAAIGKVRALKILDAARKLGHGDNSVVFVSKRGREMGGEQSELPRLFRSPAHGFES